MSDNNVEQKEEMYYINYYRNNDGSVGKIKGEWKLTIEDAEEEKISYLYRVKLDLHWTQMAGIKRSVVEKLAKEHNITIYELLRYV